MNGGRYQASAENLGLFSSHSSGGGGGLSVSTFHRMKLLAPQTYDTFIREDAKIVFQCIRCSIRHQESEKQPGKVRKARGAIGALLDLACLPILLIGRVSQSLICTCSWYVCPDHPT